jgi:hypothetical protein
VRTELVGIVLRGLSGEEGVEASEEWEERGRGLVCGCVDVRGILFFNIF